MDLFSSKINSTPFTLDTYDHNSSTFGLSLFQKEIQQVSSLNIVFPSSEYQFFYSFVAPTVFRMNHSTLSVNVQKLIIGKDIFIECWVMIRTSNYPQQSISMVKSELIQVFIYDWDDTLLFTTFLKSKKFTELNQDTKKYLKQLDDIVFNILDYSLRRGSVFIITNSLDGWIKYSSKVYLPKVHQKILSSNKILLLSARQLFQQHYPNDLKMWKVSAFKKLKQYLRKDILTNVICVGDRLDDLQACEVLVKEFDLIYIKKIKLEEKPKPDELIKELKLLQKRFQQIFHAIANTTIKLEKRILTPQNIRKNSQDGSPQAKTYRKSKKQ